MCCAGYESAMVSLGSVNYLHLGREAGVIFLSPEALITSMFVVFGDSNV